MNEQNKQVLKKWSQSNANMLIFSTIAFLSILLCFSFRGPNDKLTRDGSIALFLGSVIVGKGLDFATQNEKSPTSP